PAQCDLNLAATGCRFRRDLWRVARKQDEQAALGAGVLDRDPREPLDELVENDLARHRLRSLDHRPDIQLLDRRAHGSGGRCRDWRVAEMRMKLFELSRLAERTPAKIAAPPLPQIGMRNGLDTARRVEPSGHLMGEA